MALSVMTWNVENLFPQGPGDPQEEIDRYQAKLDLLAGTVTVLNPDVIALQELGPGALTDLASEELFPRTDRVHRDLPVVDSHIDFSSQLPSIPENPNLRAREIEPDHAPVTAVFGI